ncbi:hypothetical protein F5Y04DRAFT_274614 [Hypomontagnella monticulosa]|nr:hypothetical protein F5Y04DRAFT_274614 [Hypomontagnella monticulosa]
MGKNSGRWSHHCPKKSEGGCKTRVGYCTEHQVLCRVHKTPTLKGQDCLSCKQKGMIDEKKERKENQEKKEKEKREKEEKAIQAKERGERKKPRHKKN